MTSLALRIDARPLVLALIVATAAFSVGVVAGHAPLQVPFLLAAALVVAALAFLRTEIAIHLLILSMLLSPEFTIGGALGSASLEGSRSAVIRIEDILVVTIGAAWLAKIAVHKRLGLILRTPLNAAIALYAVVICVTTILGMVGGRVEPVLGALFAGKYLEYFVIYFVVVNHTRDRKALMRMLVTAGITAALVAIVAIVQIPGGERVTAPFEGTGGEPNTLGGYLVLMMAILGGIALEARSRRLRIGVGLAVALLAVPLLYTLSRSSWLAAGGAAAVLLATTRRRRLLLGILLVAGVALVLFAPAEVAERAAYTFTEHDQSVRVGDVAFDPSASARMRSWRDVFADYRQFPLLGYGVTGYGFIDAQYFRILVECGLLGLASFGLLVFLVLRSTWRAAGKVSDPLLRGMTVGFLAATAGLLVHAIGANTFIIVRIMEPFWLFAGLAMIAPLVDTPSESDRDGG